MQPALLVIAVFIGVACYKESARFVDRSGRGPWGCSPAAWAVIGFLLGLIGALLLYIAEKTTKARPERNVVWSATPDPRFAPQPQWSPTPDPRFAPPQWQPPAPPPPSVPPASRAPGAPSGEEFLPRR
jgi:hypothetical protein